jgi:hypothetical protein
VVWRWWQSNVRGVSRGVVLTEGCLYSVRKISIRAAVLASSRGVKRKPQGRVVRRQWHRATVSGVT